MKKTIMVKGVECRLERVGIYCKKGAYSHGCTMGWQAVDMEGNVFVDGHPGQPHSADEYQQPKFKTRKELVEDIEFDNEEWENRNKRRIAKGLKPLDPRW